jgi:hypothetical protein
LHTKTFICLIIIKLPDGRVVLADPGEPMRLTAKAREARSKCQFCLCFRGLRGAMRSFPSLAEKIFDHGSDRITRMNAMRIGRIPSAPNRATIRPNLRTLRRFNRDEQDLQDGVERIIASFCLHYPVDPVHPCEFLFGLRRCRARVIQDEGTVGARRF